MSKQVEKPSSIIIAKKDEIYEMKKRNLSFLLANMIYSGDLLKYKIIEIALYEEGQKASKEEIVELFDMKKDEIEMLSEVDYSIANIIKTLSIHDENVKDEFNSLISSNYESEKDILLDYLTRKTFEYLN